MFSWHLLDLVDHLGEVRFVPNVIDSGHCQAGGDVLVAFTTGHVLGNLVSGQLFKVPIPDPAGVNPVGVIGVEQEGKTEWLWIGFDHVEDLVEANWVLDQDDRNLLTINIDDFLPPEDPFVRFKGVLDLFGSHTHETA